MAALAMGFKAVRGNFFDAQKVLAAIDRFEAKALSKFGAFTRRRMKSSIRYRNGSAAAGQPPSAHRSGGFTKTKTNKKTGATSRQQQSPLRELIFFALAPEGGSVVIGPVAFGSGVARTIEQGGSGWRKNPRTGRREPATFQPHPFAEPAGRAEAQNFRELLRSLVK